MSGARPGYQGDRKRAQRSCCRGERSADVSADGTRSTGVASVAADLRGEVEKFLGKVAV
jgi:hypothetical protein